MHACMYNLYMYYNYNDRTLHVQLLTMVDHLRVTTKLSFIDDQHATSVNMLNYFTSTCTVVDSGSGAVEPPFCETIIALPSVNSATLDLMEYYMVGKMQLP